MTEDPKRGALRNATLLRGVGLSSVLDAEHLGKLTAFSCAGPPWAGPLEAAGDGIARGRVLVQDYTELRLRFSDELVRLRVDLPVTGNGTIAVQGDDYATLTWNGSPMRVHYVEHHANLSALDNLRWRYRGPVHDETQWYNFTVHSGWNRGVTVYGHIGHRDMVREQIREHLPEALPQTSSPLATMTLTLHAPNETEMGRWEGDTPFERGDFKVASLEPGMWAVRLDVEIQRGLEQDLAMEALVNFRYA